MQQKQKNQKNARTSNTKATLPAAVVQAGKRTTPLGKCKNQGAGFKPESSPFLREKQNKEQRRKQGITVGSVFWVLTLELFLGSVYVYFGFAARIIWNRIRFILWV